MDQPIRDINDLRIEIQRLRELREEQGTALSKRFNSPSALFSTIFSLFPKSGGDGEKSSGFFDQDIVGILSRFLIPFTLNKTLFRRSNFIVKTLVGLVSQKLSHFISEDSVAGIWDRVTSLFKSKTAKPTPAHRGVPAYSEAS
jgi:hypothetical protein